MEEMKAGADMTEAGQKLDPDEAIGLEGRSAAEGQDVRGTDRVMTDQSEAGVMRELGEAVRMMAPGEPEREEPSWSRLVDRAEVE